MDTCEECGFTYRLDEAETAGPSIVEAAGRLAAVLGDGDGAELRRRREPDVWSPLEYACHVRDVFLVQRERVFAARRVDRPELEPMGRDERVDYDGYAAQDPADVARQIGDAARLFANVLARLDAADWERTVVYAWPVVAERTVRWVAVHTEHEARHHLMDVERQLRV
jgi:DinB superfamily